MDVIDECLRFKRRVLADLVKQFMNSLGRDPQVLWNPTHVHTYTNQQKWFRQSKSKNKVNHNGRKVSLIFYSLNVKSFPHTLLPLPTSFFVSIFRDNLNLTVQYLWLCKESVKKKWNNWFRPLFPVSQFHAECCANLFLFCVFGAVFVCFLLNKERVQSSAITVTVIVEEFGTQTGRFSAEAV